MTPRHLRSFLTATVLGATLLVVSSPVANGAPTATSVEQAQSDRPDSVTLKDDYPYKNDSWHEAEKWGFYKRECTSFVAYRLNEVMEFSNTMKGGRFSDAHNWDDNAKRLGFKVDKDATVGSVMVRESGRFGHVAIVAEVEKDRVLVEQYNAGGTHRYSKGWLSREGKKFIHFTS